jgi:hypothetical protein
LGTSQSFFDPILGQIAVYTELLALRIVLLASIVLYAVILFVSSFRFRGCTAVGMVIWAGVVYIFYQPTFFFTFLNFAIARYDSTSWR